MEWIKVKDKFPQHMEKVLFITKSKRVYFGRHRIKDQFYSFDNDCTVFGVTHWMPLPEPPKP